MDVSYRNEGVVKYLNAGCGTHYANGWINTDVWQDDTTRPDVLTIPGQPYPFDDNEFDAAYLGHVLEHIPWKEVPAFLEDIFRVVKPNAPILIVGPDVLRTIKLWAQGKEPWHMVLSTMEHLETNYQPGREHQEWEGAHHHWNCHEDRVTKLLTSMGKRFVIYSDLIPNNPAQVSWHDIDTNITWPVVGKHHWQFGVLTFA